jgi:quinol monooxygenase YgiN
MIVVVARHELRSEQASTFPDQLQEFTGESRREPGVISFDWARSTDDPSVYFLIEVFRDAAAGQAHTQSDHFRKAIGLLPELLSAPPEIIHVEASGEGWGRMSEVSPQEITNED